jgi:hypothetical protein
MRPPPRSLTFAVSTSLLTASLSLAGCDDPKKAVNPGPVEQAPENKASGDEPEPDHVNVGPEDPEPEPKPPVEPIHVNEGPEPTEPPPEPPLKVNPGPDAEKPEPGPEPKRVNVRPNEP